MKLSEFKNWRLGRLIPCEQCQDTGQCSSCNGDGEGADDDDCGYCDGSGICALCENDPPELLIIEFDSGVELQFRIGADDVAQLAVTRELPTWIETIVQTAQTTV